MDSATVVTPAPGEAAASGATVSQRLVSLDAFRGATIASMILVNNPGGPAYEPLRHAEWHGWTFTDTVFPFFLWISGVAMTLSIAKRVERGDDRRKLLLHVLRRGALIFLIGFLLGGFPFYNLESIRIPGVLQRIGICYLVAGTIFLYTRWRGQAIATALLLIVYWMLMTLVPVPGYGPGVLDKEGNLARYVDGLVLSGHMWSMTKTWDPEGIVSTLPAIATMLFGILAGHLLRRAGTAAERAAWMFTSGAVLLFAGAMMDHWLPINKNLWTSSFSVFMAGMAFTAFACFYWIVDTQGWKRWTRPFVIYGMNALAAFVASGLLAKVMNLAKWKKPLVDSVFSPVGPPEIASLAYALANVGAIFLVAWVMYRRGWFVRL